VYLAHHKLDRTREGIPYLEMAIKVDPKEELSHKLLAGALSDVGDKEGAIKSWEAAQKLNPDAEIHAAVLAALHIDIGRYEKGIEYARIVLDKKDPNNLEVLRLLGSALILQGNNKEAIVHLKKYLKRRRDDVLIHYLVGIAYSQMGDGKSAKKQVAILKKLSPSQAKQLADLIE